MIFHKCKWKMLESYKFDSELLKFLDNNLLKSIKMDGTTINNLAKRGVITVVQCVKCSKVNHIKTIL